MTLTFVLEVVQSHIHCLTFAIEYLGNR